MSKHIKGLNFKLLIILSGIMIILTAGCGGSGVTGVSDNTDDITGISPVLTPTVSSVLTPTPGTSPGGAEYTIDQTLSDECQRNTLAFDGLAFITGSLGADSFLPPGKVADYSGFQYLRDNDATKMGHNTDFVTIIASNILNILTTEQINQLVERANSQVSLINEYAYKRFVLMKAFRRLLEGDLPSGTTGLSKSAVMQYSGELYLIDGEISFDRAELFGTILSSLTAEQKAELDALKALNGVGNWDKNLSDPLQGLGLGQDVHVAVMTYASEMYSWYAGSVEADTYFCPERQATYFGSFYLKDAPAMGNPNYTINENITSTMGASFLEGLNTEQSVLVTDLVDIQRSDLYEIVTTRSSISEELRRFLTESKPDSAGIRTNVLGLSEMYGELDGEIVYYYATHFVGVNQTLTDARKEEFMALRKSLLGDLAPSGAYLYSEPISMPDIPNTDFLFE